MKAMRCIWQLFGLAVLCLLIGTPTKAQLGRERLEALRARLQELKQFFDSLSEEERRALSGSAQNLMQLASSWNEIEDEIYGALPQVQQLDTQARTRLGRYAGHGGAEIPSSVPPVSDPSTDFVTSVVTGFTQSETSTAWCGGTVVVGFNDSGSLVESLLMGPGGGSVNGVARSDDQGATFTDLGFLNPGPGVFDFLASDPVVGCTSENTFYYASIFQTGTPSLFLSAISVSRSTDGGLTFSDPVRTVVKPQSTHFLDKEWMAVDPTDPNRLFVTYTDFDRSLNICGTTPSGAIIPRTAIELVRSTDGGLTWSDPLVIDEVCGANFVQGSQVAVGPSGEVYGAWERFVASFSGPRSVRIRRSNDHGATFGPTVVVDSVTPSGDGFALQGGFRNFLTGSLAVDRSGGATNGYVYFAWDDGRNLRVPDFGGINRFYGYSDILVSRSTDGGMTWSSAVRVNNNLEPLKNGRGGDQYQPGIAVDHRGRVGVCFYDRRRDEFNFRVGRTCAISRDAGATWRNRQISIPAFPPIHGNDNSINAVYMGDYDTLASDFTEGTRGFVGAFQFINTKDVFQPNPDVKSNRIGVSEED
jgi:hypothetical protein